MAALRRRLVLAALLGAGLVGLIVLSGVGYFVKRAHDGSAEDLDALLADLRSRGEPVSIDDLAGPSLMAGDDGAPLLSEANAWLDVNAPPEDEWPWAGEYTQTEFAALPEVERARHVEFVRAMEPFLSRTRTAVERSEVRLWASPTHALDDGDRSIVPTIQRTQRLLTAAVRVSTTADDRLRSVRAMGLLGARVQRPKGGMHALVAMTVTGSALHHLRDALELGLVPAAAARDASEPLLATAMRPRVHRALRGERVQTIAMVRTLVGDESSAPYDGPIVEGWMGGLSRTSLAEWITEVQDVLDAGHARWSDLGRATVSLDARMRPRLRRRDPGGAVSGAASILFPHIVTKGAEVTAKQRLAYLSIAALEQFEATGTWPEWIAELPVAPEQRIDPFTNRPFVLERLSDGVRFLSPGPVDPEVWGERLVNRYDPQADGLVWTLRR